MQPETSRSAFRFRYSRQAIVRPIPHLLPWQQAPILEPKIQRATEDKIDWHHLLLPETSMKQPTPKINISSMYNNLYLVQEGKQKRFQSGFTS